METVSGNGIILNTMPNYLVSEKKSQTWQPCTRNFITGKCGSGHIFAKQLVCGKEYCPDCGNEESITHNRRISRWWNKIFSFKTVGYLVVTVPSEFLDFFKNRKNLSEFKKYSIITMKELGFKQGLFRFHWYGDCKLCEGKGCDECKGTGAGNVWRPHINILVEQGYLKEEIFKNFTDSLKSYFRCFFESITGEPMPEGKDNVFYSYRSTPEKICHTLKYVTRSTFRIYNKEIADLLHGFRASQTWGKFGNIKHETMNNSTILLENGKCPCCKLPIKWNPILIKTEIFRKLNFIDIKDGYYQIILKPPI